jgi:predicted nuclease with RNAse H fold
MRLIGLDLGAQPARTSICEMAWDETPVVVAVDSVAHDDLIIEWCDGADAIGIDCPFGWPIGFVEMVKLHAAGASTSIAAATEELRMRRCDVFAWKATGKQPLSVSTDKLGIVAFRAVRLLERLRGPGFDRSGTEGVYEVYPGGALATWGLPSRGYKRRDGLATRELIVAELERVIDFGPAHRRVIESDDDLDAVICAYLAGLAAQGATTPPPPELAAAAAVEGWIHLPSGPLTRPVN